MPNGSSPLITFSIRKPYQTALVLVRDALSEHGLLAAAELDVTSRIKQELGVGVAACTVLLVDDPTLLLEGIVFHRGAALWIPQRVVISGNERHTEVFVRSANSNSLVAGGFPSSLLDPIGQLQERIIRTMEMIAEREEPTCSFTCD
jgi:uncharacterized protein (DUF302 family)